MKTERMGNNERKMTAVKERMNSKYTNKNESIRKKSHERTMKKMQPRKPECDIYQ